MTEIDQQGSKNKLLKAGAKFEEAVLCLLLASMILLSCLQIGLRTFFSSGMLWADPLIRQMVLWSGLLGAAMATSRGDHIALDLAGYLIPERFQNLVKLFCHIFSCITAGFLVWASILFLRSEMEFGSPGLFDIQGWVWNCIFPFAFMLITIRYFLLTITILNVLFRKEGSEEGKK